VHEERPDGNGRIGLTHRSVYQETAHTSINFGVWFCRDSTPSLGYSKFAGRAASWNHWRTSQELPKSTIGARRRICRTRSGTRGWRQTKILRSQALAPEASAPTRSGRLRIFNDTALSGSPLAMPWPATPSAPVNDCDRRELQK